MLPGAATQVETIHRRLCDSAVALASPGVILPALAEVSRLHPRPPAAISKQDPAALPAVLATEGSRREAERAGGCPCAVEEGPLEPPGWVAALAETDTEGEGGGPDPPTYLCHAEGHRCATRQDGHVAGSAAVEERHGAMAGHESVRVP